MEDRLLAVYEKAVFQRDLVRPEVGEDFVALLQEHDAADQGKILVKFDGHALCQHLGGFKILDLVIDILGG